MKISSLAFTAALLAATPYSYAATRQPMVSIKTVPGVNGHFNSCPTNSIVNGICSSGKHGNCLNNQQFVAFTCEANPLLIVSTSSLSNWICGNAGQDLQCPAGQVMVGMCGAGENPDCGSPCSSKSYGAIRCATPESSGSSGIGISVGDVQWQRPQHFTSPINQCPVNTVACGACQSGKDENCKGTGAYEGSTGGFTVGCCEIETNSTKFSTNLYEAWDGYHQSSSQTTVSCAKSGELITGLCVAPQGQAEYQCQVNGESYDNAVQCSKNPNPQAPTGQLSTWLDASSAPGSGLTNGNWASCPQNQLPSRITFTDSVQGGQATMSFECSALSSGVQLNRTDAYAICDSYPQRLTCAPGYAVLSACAGSSCNTGACSGQSSTILGLQCVRVTGYQYEGLAAGSPVADNSTASWQVVSCDLQNIDYTSASPTTQASYTIDNTVTQQSSVMTTVESTQSSGNSITESTGSQYEISSTGGLPIGQLLLTTAELAGEAAAARKVRRSLGSTTETNTTYSGYTVETSFDTSTSYITQQYDSVTLSKTISETVYLSGGYVWDVVSWGVAITTAGNYTVNYMQYGPGLVATPVQEVVQQTNTALSDTTYLLVLSSEYYPESYLSRTDCSTIASDYMSGSDPFTDNAPVDNTNNTTSGVQQVGPPSAFGKEDSSAGAGRVRRALRARGGGRP